MIIEIYGKIPSEKGTIHELSQFTLKLAIIHADSMFEGLQQVMAWSLTKSALSMNATWTKILIKD